MRYCDGLRNATGSQNRAIGSNNGRWDVESLDIEGLEAGRLYVNGVMPRSYCLDAKLAVLVNCCDAGFSSFLGGDRYASVCDDGVALVPDYTDNASFAGLGRSFPATAGANVRPVGPSMGKESDEMRRSDEAQDPSSKPTGLINGNGVARYGAFAHRPVRRTLLGRTVPISG